MREAPLIALCQRGDAPETLSRVPMASTDQFDPTGRWLAGWAYFYDDPNHGFKFNLATGTEEIKIPKRPDKDARNLTWSPDGRHLAMMYDGDGDSVFDVCLMNADGTGVAVLQKGADSTTTVRGWRG